MKVRMQTAAVTPVRYGNPSQPSYPQNHSSYPYPLPQSQPSTASYLPALPKGIVTEDIVASLPRYQPYEQNAWIQSLPPPAMAMYRQIVNINEARKRNSATPSTSALPTVNANTSKAHPQISDLPSAFRPGGINATLLPNRQAPPLPTIKYLDFAFTVPRLPGDRREAIRLHNMRGVITHAVVLAAETTELEITAYTADTSRKTTPDSQASDTTTPEVSLRFNNISAGPSKAVFESTRNGIENGLDKPVGQKWSISVPQHRGDSRIEVVAAQPGVAAETTVIYVNRQL